MTRRLVLLAALLMMIGQAASIRVLARDGPDAIPLSGTVVDGNGTAVGGARVILVRVSHRFNESSGMKILASTETDAVGVFSLGPVQVNTAVSFPLESGVDLEYRIATDDQARKVEGIDFTAPRQGGVITSVTAKIRIK